MLHATISVILFWHAPPPNSSFFTLLCFCVVFPDTTGTSLEQSIEGRYLNVRQRKQALYRQNCIITLSIDNCSLFLPSASCLYSGKFRHRLRRKIAESKRLLLKDIETYNSHEPAMPIDVNEVEQSLSGDNPSPTWPWEVHGSGKRSFLRPLIYFVKTQVKIVIYTFSLPLL